MFCCLGDGVIMALVAPMTVDMLSTGDSGLCRSMWMRDTCSLDIFDMQYMKTASPLLESVIQLLGICFVVQDEELCNSLVRCHFC